MQVGGIIHSLSAYWKTRVTMLEKLTAREQRAIVPAHNFCWHACGAQGLPPACRAGCRMTFTDL